MVTIFSDRQTFKPFLGGKKFDFFWLVWYNFRQKIELSSERFTFFDN